MKVYAVKNKNDGTRLQSSSGGIFSLLAEQIINKGGSVSGFAWNGLDVEQKIIFLKEDINLLRGSKYVESKIEKIPVVINAPLLWSGTPCQMLKPQDNLYQIDVICHGTPTKESFKNYCEENGITKINFRDKKNGWCNYNVTTNKSTEPFIKNKFMQDFINNKNLCKKCYNCQFKNFKSNSDIQIGDFWGIGNEYPEFADNIGVSAVFIKTKKGEELFNKIKDKVDYIEVTKESVIKYNPSLVESVKR